jgi:hypothetical protein
MRIRPPLDVPSRAVEVVDRFKRDAAFADRRFQCGTSDTRIA